MSFAEAFSRLPWSAGISPWSVFWVALATIGAEMFFIDGLTTGRTDGALIRLTTEIASDEISSEAKARLWNMPVVLQGPPPRFIPSA